MAEIFNVVNGMRIQKYMAYHPAAQQAVREHAIAIQRKAAAALAQHRHDGHARITRERGLLDQYVVLNDERGLKAAMTIEKGRKPSERDRGMEGLHILQNAAGGRIKA